MLLKPEEAERFYRIWWPLLDWVNRQNNLVSDWPKNAAAGKGVSVAAALPVRDALWQNAALLDEFVAQNPAKLSEADLTLALSWKHHVSGNFAVVKHLKKHSVFLGDGQDGYAVLGLLSPLREVTPDVPAFVKATLLPFEDHIIYDGIIVGAPFFLGPGIRDSLKHQLEGIEESVGLVTTLPDHTSARRKRIAAGNERLLLAFRASLLGGGMSEKLATEHMEKIVPLGGEMAEETEPRALWNLDLLTARRYIAENPKTATSIKRLARFFFDTGRSSEETVFDLQEIRKR